jgi:hypothetical protein
MELRAVRRGRVVVYPVRELERWVERNAATVLEGERWTTLIALARQTP